MNHRRNPTERHARHRNRPHNIGRRLHCEPLEARYMLSGVSFTSHEIIDSAGCGGLGRCVYPADLDGDGDLDVLAALRRRNQIAWFENADGQGNFGSRQVITTQVDGPWGVHAADVDGDGDVDVLSASGRDGKFAWYENTDGRGNFGEQQVVRRHTPNGAHWIHAADVDGDGDLDVLTATHIGDSGPGGPISWHENTDGRGTFGAQRIIKTSSFHTRGVDVVDLDGDGDVDVLFTDGAWDHFQTPRFSWSENTDGRGNFGHPQIIDEHGGFARPVHAADVDGDGDMDPLMSFFHRTGGVEKVWYENTDGQGAFGPRQAITNENRRAVSMYAADIDGDGDVDVVSGGGNGTAWSGNIAWYENTNGGGDFGPAQVILSPAGRADSLCAADIDGDGDVDILSASELSNDNIVWYENQGIPGDANEDGRVDAQDLNVVGMNWQGRDRAWEQGDFTRDGIVNAADLNVLAMNWQYGVALPASAPLAHNDQLTEAVDDKRLPTAPLSALIGPIATTTVSSTSSSASADESQPDNADGPSASPLTSRFEVAATPSTARRQAHRGFYYQAPRETDHSCADVALAEELRAGAVVFRGLHGRGHE
jgi:hypothetical protein